MTLTEFLLVRIAEDDLIARAARDEAPELRWEPQQVHDGVYSLDLSPSTHLDTDAHGVEDDQRMSRGVAIHIARHDPARVLAECAAKRRIVELAEDALKHATTRPPKYHARVTLRALASAWADHEDYRQEWAL